MASGMESVHVFTAPMQSALRYKPQGLDFFMHNKANAIGCCYRCRRKRRMKNMLVQSFYDGDRFFCKEGNCKPAKRR